MKKTTGILIAGASMLALCGTAIQFRSWWEDHTLAPTGSERSHELKGSATHPSGRERRVQTDDPNAVQHKLAQLWAKISELEQRAEDMNQRAPGETRSDGPSEFDSLEPGEATGRPSAEKIAEDLNAHLEAEVADGDWSTPTERAFTTSFAGFAGRAAVGSVECRATLCRLDVTYANATARSDFLDELPPGPFQNTTFFMHAMDDGTKVTFYVARPGHPLPGIRM